MLCAIHSAAGKRPSRPTVLVPVGQQDLIVADDHSIGGDADVHSDTLPRDRGTPAARASGKVLAATHHVGGLERREVWSLGDSNS
jgi:hypothetical protein